MADERLIKVAAIIPVLHYTMGGVDLDIKSRVLSTTPQPIPARREPPGRLESTRMRGVCTGERGVGGSGSVSAADDEQGGYQGRPEVSRHTPHPPLLPLLHLLPYICPRFVIGLERVHDG